MTHEWVWAGAVDLLTLCGKRVLEATDIVYAPGQLSETVAPQAREGTAAFVTLRDPHIYPTSASPTRSGS